MSQLKGEKRFLNDRMAAMQKQLEQQIDSSPQIYLSEIKRLKNELTTKGEALNILIQKIQPDSKSERSNTERQPGSPP